MDLPAPESDDAFESVFRKMLKSFSLELKSGWNIFRTEKHIIMEISSSPLASFFGESNERVDDEGSAAYPIEITDLVPVHDDEIGPVGGDDDDPGETYDDLEWEPDDARLSILPEASFDNFDEEAVNPVEIAEVVPGSEKEASSRKRRRSNRSSRCDQCEKSFANARHLVRHVKAVHMGLKYECPHCGHFYARPDSLKHHVDTRHADEESNSRDAEEDAEGWRRRLPPTPPEDAFSTAPEETSVKRTPHRPQKKETICAFRVRGEFGEDQLGCPYCNVRESTPEALQEHLRDSHRGKIHLCLQCYTLFSSPWKLRRHLDVHRRRSITS